MELHIIKVSYSQKSFCGFLSWAENRFYIYKYILHYICICIHIYKHNSRTSVHREEEKQWETGQKKVKNNDPHLKTSQWHALFFMKMKINELIKNTCWLGILDRITGGYFCQRQRCFALFCRLQSKGYPEYHHYVRARICRGWPGEMVQKAMMLAVCISWPPD